MLNKWRKEVEPGFCGRCIYKCCIAGCTIGAVFWKQYNCNFPFITCGCSHRIIIRGKYQTVQKIYYYLHLHAAPRLLYLFSVNYTILISSLI